MRHECERTATLSEIRGQRFCHLDPMKTRETISLDARAQQRLIVLTHILAGELDLATAAQALELSERQAPADRTAAGRRSSRTPAFPNWRATIAHPMRLGPAVVAAWRPATPRPRPSVPSVDVSVTRCSAGSIRMTRLVPSPKAWRGPPLDTGARHRDRPRSGSARPRLVSRFITWGSESPPSSRAAGNGGFTPERFGTGH